MFPSSVETLTWINWQLRSRELKGLISFETVITLLGTLPVLETDTKM